MRRLCFPTAVLLLAPAALAAQAGKSSPGGAVLTAVQESVQRMEPNIVGAAQEMPADKYGYKPTAKQRSFAETVGHVAGSNGYLCSKLSGMEAPASLRPKKGADKDELVAALKASFEFCGRALQKVEPNQLTDMVPFFGGRQVTKGAALVDLASDLADHYAAMAMYLRLNGLLPPSAQPRS